jgi:hypothetical protein
VQEPLYQQMQDNVYRELTRKAVVSAETIEMEKV